MSAQDNLQALLRLLTTGRNKLTMIAAMGRVKALRAADLADLKYSIAAIATADLEIISKAINDTKAAKSLQAACKMQVKDPNKKRPAESSLLSAPKRTKSIFELAPELQTPHDIEAALALPQPSEDEEAISNCSVYTNRAPLVLAFAVSLLKYTMSEQPLSSRLSLGQAVVSLNSRTKAANLGLDKESTAKKDGWGTGQPRIRILGREVHILKRGDYDWKTKDEESEVKPPVKTFSMFGTEKKEHHEWTVSVTVTSKKSTFVARSIAVSSPGEARSELQKLMASNAELREASHNITAWRVPRDQGGIIEESNDDGECGGGRHILEVMKSSDIVGALLVVTRWYGGIMLGTDRWRLMTQVSQDTLSQRLRITGIVGAEPLWGLDLDSMQNKDSLVGGASADMPIYRPEGARTYLLKSFPNPPPIATGENSTKKKQTAAEQERELERNLSLLLGALDKLFASWVEQINRDELDRRAWAWYVKVRPDIQSGVAGWGGKAEVKLSSILDLRRSA
ncbi:hypothetical protein BJ878DRAFT_462833 [Calycina marina]|uniref:Impact N-terminal domain-containing protein n=1 Tax=Calycina marina TaxID=1763456 RepID=A0A9P8CFD4_9HELO|nr:hypothetical protein BJ878DRAFT_462833 [Calycina marina]